jgi:hypothetical protein
MISTKTHWFIPKHTDFYQRRSISTKTHWFIPKHTDLYQKTDFYQKRPISTKTHWFRQKLADFYQEYKMEGGERISKSNLVWILHIIMWNNAIVYLKKCKSGFDSVFISAFVSPRNIYNLKVIFYIDPFGNAWIYILYLDDWSGSKIVGTIFNKSYIILLLVCHFKKTFSS